MNDENKRKWALFYIPLSNGAKSYHYTRWKLFIVAQICMFGSLYLVSTHICEEQAIKDEVEKLNRQSDNLFNTNEKVAQPGKAILRPRKNKNNDA